MFYKLLAVPVLAFSAFASDPALLQYLPPDAVAVTGIDVEKTKNSPFGRFIVTQISEDHRAFSELQAATGFDPRRDVRSVIVAAAPGDNNAVFVARGTFDQSRIISAARAEGASIFVHEGLNVIAGKEGHGDSWLAFVDSTTVVGGRAERVRAALAQAKTAVKQPFRDEAIALGNRYDAWVVTTDPATGFMKSIPGNQNGDTLRSVQHASGGVTFGVNVVIDATATTRSDRDATALHDVARFLTGMIQSKAENEGAGQAASLLSSIKLRTNGNKVEFSVTVSESELENLIDSSRRRTKHIARN